MSETYQFGLPLIAPAQAQKHVTVNEALSRLDALAQLRVVSAAVQTPPEAPQEGTAYIVPAGATGAWDGQTGALAIYANGGWAFVSARQGWRAWNEADARGLVHNGVSWGLEAVASGLNGARLDAQIVEIEHPVFSGPSNVPVTVVPANTLIIGMTGRVVQDLSGATLTGWSLGYTGAETAFGGGLPLSSGSEFGGVVAPLAVQSNLPLVLTSEGGDFDTGGIVRLAISVLSMTAPSGA